jgi:hypothetical protein
MLIRRRRRKIQNDNASSDTAQMMNLSLFIMLLAFFIVLNAISSYEEVKSAAVRESVAMAFNRDADIRERLSSDAPDESKSVNKGDAFDRLEALFDAQIASYEVTRSNSMGVMMVEMPLEEFSRAVMAVGQKDLTRYPTRRAVRENAFLPTLVSIMRKEIRGAPTRMEILFQADKNPARMQNQSPTEVKKIIDMGGALVQHLEKRGMPQKLVNIGIQKGKEDRVNLVFRKYVPFSPVKKEGERDDNVEIIEAES